MSPATASLILLSALFVLAVAIVVVPVGDSDSARAGRALNFDRVTGAQLASSASVGSIVLACSGWVVPAIVIGAATWHWVGSWQRRDRGRASDVERTDALASWIENLRDVLLAGDQPIGAITATVQSAPPAIRPAVRRLSATLGHQDPDTAFRRFADELDDPLGDLVAAGLLIAVERGARTVGVLTALADQARAQANRRRIVDAERAPIQREVTLLTLIMGALVIALVVLGRGDYLRAYDTAGGQTFLTIVIAIYATLLLRVQRLARFPKPSRFLTSSGARNQAPVATPVGAHR